VGLGQVDGGRLGGGVVRDVGLLGGWDLGGPWARANKVAGAGPRPVCRFLGGGVFADDGWTREIFGFGHWGLLAASYGAGQGIPRPGGQNNQSQKRLPGREKAGFFL